MTYSMKAYLEQLNNEVKERVNLTIGPDGNIEHTMTIDIWANGQWKQCRIVHYVNWLDWLTKNEVSA